MDVHSTEYGKGVGVYGAATCIWTIHSLYIQYVSLIELEVMV